MNQEIEEKRIKHPNPRFRLLNILKGVTGGCVVNGFHLFFVILTKGKQKQDNHLPRPSCFQIHSLCKGTLKKSLSL